MSAIETVLDRLEGVRKVGDGWQAKCPSHEDRHPSLSIGVGDDGRVLLKCQANCETTDVLAAIGLKLGDLFERERDDRGSIVATYDYEDEQGALLYQVVRFEPKRFLQRRPDGRDGWIWKLEKTRRVLYRLPRVLEAVAAGATVYVVEGEKDVHALEAAGVVATTSAMGAGKWRDSYAKTLRGADVVVVADRDDAGREHAAKIAESLADAAQNVRVVEAVEGKDAADHLAAGHTVDEFVPVRLNPQDTQTKAAEVSSTAFDEPPPALSELLEEIATFLRRFIVMTPAQVAAVSLWIVHTHAIDAADTAAYIAATSAEKRSGKTRLLEVLELLVRKPLSAANISDAALFRAVEQMAPTVLFDEIDAIFGPKARDREDLRGMLNAGYRRGARVYRMQGANNSDLGEFAVFCPKAFAGIGNLPDTIADRTIGIRLERRTSAEKIERFRRREVEPEAARLRERIVLCVHASLDDLVAARPALPEELDDRAQDVWEPLLAIADLAGGVWLEQARSAALELSAGEAREDESLGTRLLADIRDAFETTGRDRLPTVDLIAELAKVEESPWGDWFGKTISPQALGKLLKPYRIKTMPVWVDAEKHRGYKAEQFEDSWLRVLGGRGGRSGRSESPSGEASTTPTTATAHHASDDIDWSDVQQATLELQRETGEYGHPLSDVIAKAEGNGSNGRIPRLGDDDFLDLVAAAFHAGHLTTGEALEREKLHKLVLRAAS